MKGECNGLSAYEKYLIISKGKGQQLKIKKLVQRKCELIIHDFKCIIVTGSMSSVFSSKIYFKIFNNLSSYHFSYKLKSKEIKMQ